MNILSFIGVFKNIVFKRVVGCHLERCALFCRERYCEEYIFDDVQKKIDFPKVIPDFTVEIAGLYEQKQGAGKVNDKANHEPEIGFLVDEDHLWFIHLVEQVKDRVGNDQDRFYRGGQGIKTLVVMADSNEILGNRKNVKNNRRTYNDDPEYFVVYDRKQQISKNREFNYCERAKYGIDDIAMVGRIKA